MKYVNVSFPEKAALLVFSMLRQLLVSVVAFDTTVRERSIWQKQIEVRQYSLPQNSWHPLEKPTEKRLPHVTRTRRDSRGTKSPATVHSIRRWSGRNIRFRLHRCASGPRSKKDSCQQTCCASRARICDVGVSLRYSTLRKSKSRRAALWN